jgi:exodeoxyribonuclease V alpha subunit
MGGRLYSDAGRRSINMSPHPFHRTTKGEFVRSTSEVVVAETLTRLGISYEYEKPLPSPNNLSDFCVPDFTVTFGGDTFYWEHLLSLPLYLESWEHKKRWYERNGFSSRLITSENGLDGRIDGAQIERIACSRILAARILFHHPSRRTRVP